MTAWTQDRVAVIQRHAATHSAQQIGDMLGCSRSAVLGYAHRNGIRLSSPIKASRPSMTPRNGGRPKGARSKTSPPRGRAHDRQVRLMAVAARLAGASFTKAAKLAGCSPQSVMNNWIKDPDLVADARRIAERAVAAAALEAARRAEAQRANAERVAAWNRGIALRVPQRHGDILLAYLEAQNMAAAADRFGVTRERVRQIVAKYEASHGFIRPRTAYRPRAARS